MERDALIETLNDLIGNCKDGELGFQTCADHVRSPGLQQLFVRRAASCRAAAHELQSMVARLGGAPDEGGSAAGAVHRGWVNLRGTVTLKDDKGMLDECERGEELAVARYRRALEDPLPPVVEQVVRRQYEGALRNYEQIRTLRQQTAADAV